MPSAFLYLGVDDVRATVTALEGRGVEVVSRPHVAAWVSFNPDAGEAVRETPKSRCVLEMKPTYRWP